MLSISPIKDIGAAVSYYSETGTYYTQDAVEVVKDSHWHGKGAEKLGLTGNVDVKTFQELLQGHLPSGQQLGKFTENGKDHRPGYDLTFSAPKSVSIMAEVLRVKSFHGIQNKAVNAALSLMEQYASQTRVSINNKIVFEPTDNLIFAKFPHHTSRENDPQTHTHCVVMNMTQRMNSQWASLSSEQLFELKMLGGMVYRSILAHELRQMGFELNVSAKNGLFELACIPQTLNELFSKRSDQIETIMEEKGFQGARAAATANLATRKSKDEIDPELLQSDWIKQMAEKGFTLEDILANVRLIAPPSQKEIQDKTDEAVQLAIQHLSEREAVFSHVELLKSTLAFGLGFTLPDKALESIEVAHQEKQLVRRFDLDGHYWTTPEAIKLEKETIGLMLNGRFSVTRVDSAENVQAALNNHSHLNTSQRQAVQHILTTPDRILGVQGYAGVGKTTMLKAVKALAESKGFILHGLAPSAVAAKQLQKESGIESDTLSKFLTEQSTHEMNLGKMSPKDGYQAKHLYVVDESSMISTKQMHELLKTIHDIGARVVLIGDKKQLGAVQAGKPFYQLQQGGMLTCVMKKILRQKDSPELLSTVHDIIAGNIKKALNKIGDNLTEIPNKDLRLTQMANEYLALDTAKRDKTLLITTTNQDRQVLNQQVRDGLKQQGALSGNSIQTSVFINRDLTQAQRVNASQYMIGDTVRFNQSYQKLKVKKGDYLEVIGIDAKSNTVLLKNSKGKTIEWQPHQIAGRRAGALEVYQTQSRELIVGDQIRWTRNDRSEGLLNAMQAKVVAIKNNKATLELNDGQLKTINLNNVNAKHWEHGYAMTAHATQGLTADWVLAHGESYQKNLTNQQSFYVVVSRAKHAVKIFTDDKEQYLKTLEKYTGEKSSALTAKQTENLQMTGKYSQSIPTKTSRSHDELFL